MIVAFEIGRKQIYDYQTPSRRVLISRSFFFFYHVSSNFLAYESTLTYNMRDHTTGGSET